MANQKIEIKFPEVPSNHPAYPLWLAQTAAMMGIPFVLLKDSLRTIQIQSWCEAELSGGLIESTVSKTGEKAEYHPAGTGYDCLTFYTPAGHEIELSASETREFIETVEIMIGRRQPLITIPEMVPPNLRTQ